MKKEDLELTRLRLERESKEYCNMIVRACTPLKIDNSYLHCNVKDLVKNLINIVDLASEYNTLLDEIEKEQNK